MGKRLLASFLAAAMMLTMAPFAFAADDSVASVTSVDGTVTNYTSLATALSKATEGSTVTLLHDTNVSGMTPTISKKNITVDLGGYTVTGIAQQTFGITGNNAVLKNGKIVNNCTKNAINAIRVDRDITVTLENIKTECSQYGLQLGTTAYRAMTVNITGDETNITGGVAAIAVQNLTVNNKGAAVSDILTLNISGGTISSEAYAIAGNGKEYQGNTIINITGGVISSDKDTAIYHPQAGKLNISGGTITGVTGGVQMCSGSLNVTGGTITATGNDETSTKTGDGSIPDGAAVSVVNRSYPGGTPSATISGGTLTSASGVDAVQAYTWTNGSNAKSNWAEAADNIGISGGTFSSDVSAYVASGYEVVQDGNSYTVKAESVAKVGDKEYTSLADAVAAAESGATVKLLKDVGLPGYVVIDKSITLDLNGKKLYNTVDIWNESNALVRIKNGADVTITGNGTMSAKENDCYAIAVVKGNLTIENGTFIGNVSAVQVEDGHLAIKGGKFDLLQKWEGKSTFLINCIDDAYHDGTAKVSISGGTFVDFNPANNEAEGEGTNFLATGYITTKVGDNYVVKANANKNITDLDTAINTIKGEASSTKKKAAVDVIKNIDNADLANNSAAMGKLAALDNTLTDTTSGPAKVTVTAETRSETGIDANHVTVTNAALSADLTSTTAQNVKVTIADGSATINADDVKAAKKAAGITDDVAVQKLNISMTVNDEPVTKPTAPVVLEFPLPADWKGCQIVCVDDANNPEVIPTTVIGNTVKATFNHFSDYAMLSSTKVANPNKYQIVLTPTNNQTTVYPGDKITFDVVLKRTEGNSDIVNRVQFTPTSDMLTVDTATAETGFTYNATSKQFTHLDASNPVTLTNGEVKVGTINCTVNNNGTLRGNLKVTVGDQDTVTVSGYQNSNGLTVAEIPVEYDAIRVYFTNYKGQLDGDGNEETERKTFYTSAGSTKLYDSLDDMVSGTVATDIPAAVDGSITNGTQYRLTYDGENENLKNWLAADGTTKYVDVVNGTGFAGTMSFYVSRVELLEVNKPDGVIIDSETKTTTRDSKTYVDKNAAFTFNVPGAATGMKNEVTVTVGNTAVTPTQDTTNKNKYTVANTDMNASPVKITVNQVIDLDVDNIKVFEDGAGKFLQYSKYSDEDTLVLIKSATGVKYTLNPDAGTEAPEIYKLPTGHGYGDFNLAVLIPRPAMLTGEDARAIMLKYLTDTYHIAVATGDNTSINAYDFDTNADGNGSGTFKLDDAQATYDFSALKKAAMYWEPSDVELLKADVLTYANANKEYNTPRDGQVTTEDVDAFLYNYVYTPSARPSDTTP